jgi:RimJ/RimL family protein N-acetyltransferase
MCAPTIETKRLILAPLRRNLFDQHFATMSDPRVTAHIGDGQPQTRIEAWRRFGLGAGLWALVGYGYWAILDRASRQMIGMGGFAEFERGIPELVGTPEVGYALSADWWGQGLTTEFLAAALGWADQHLDAPETRCIIAPDNAASIRVAEKSGFIGIGQVENELGVSLLFRRPAASVPDQG